MKGGPPARAGLQGNEGGSNMSCTEGGFRARNSSMAERHTQTSRASWEGASGIAL